MISDAASGEPTRSAAQVWLAFVVFGVLAGLALGWVCADLRPAPIYPNQNTHPDSPAVFVTRLLPLDVIIDLERPATSLSVPVSLAPDGVPLELSVMPVDDAARAATRDLHQDALEPIPGSTLDPATDSTREYAKRSVTESGLARLELDARGRAATALWLKARSSAMSREEAPLVVWAAEPGRDEYGLEVYFAGQPLERVEVLGNTGPLLIVEYAWHSRALLALWLLPLALALYVQRHPHQAVWLLVALGLAASVSSALLWQRDYTRRDAHLDADQYIESAEHLARAIEQPRALGDAGAWFRDYPHSSTMLVPALMALPIALGASAVWTYMLLCALSTFLALLLVDRMLREQLAIGPLLRRGVIFAMATHLLVVRSFARPITDAVGLLLVVATLFVLLRMAQAREHVDQKSELALAGLLLCHALARPQGLGYWLFVGLFIVALESVWSERFSLPRLLHRGLRVFVPPALILLALFLQFDWVHNVGLMFEKAARFRINATPGYFAESLIGVVQLLPILWWGARARLRDPEVALFVSWLVFNLVLLVVVQAPYWMRHFVPIVPSVLVLAAIGLDQLRDRARAAGIALLLVGALANVWISLAIIHTPGPLPAAIQGFIATP